VVHVMGTLPDVQDALERIRVTCFQVAARHSQPVSAYAINWPSCNDLPGFLQLRQHPVVGIIGRPRSSRPPAPSSTVVGVLTDGDASHAIDSSHQLATNSRLVSEAVLQTLKRVVYYRGNIHFRVRLGTLCLQNYKPAKDDRYSISSFTDMLSDPQFTGLVTAE